MNITKRISLQNVKKNWKASLLTVISISLSVTMTTMVVASLFGVYKTYEEDALYKSSKWNVMIQLEDDADEIIRALGDVVDSYAIVSDSKEIILNDNQMFGNISVSTVDFEDNYLLFSDMLKEHSNSFDDLIIEGRMPQNKDELIITSRSKIEHDLNLGDIVTVKQNIPIENGHFEPRHYSDATIVGITEESSIEITHSSALMSFDTSDPYKYLYIKFKPGTKSIENLIGNIKNNVFPSKHNPEAARHVRYNNNYNSIIGMQYSLDYTKLVLGGSSTVFIVLLSLATFSLITNAFYNNIQTQVHDYGLLRSIGATKKQLKSMIRFEGYILLTIGLVLGIGLGFGISKLLLTYINSIFTFSNQNFGTSSDWVFYPRLPWEGVLIVTAFSFILVSFPLNYSIKKLFKMTSIDAIRENSRYSRNKIKINSKNLPKSMAKQYNISDKSKFKGIKISLSITIAIFVTTMSFIKIGFGNMGEYNTSSYNVEIRPSAYNASSISSIKKINEEIDNVLSNDSNTENYILIPEYYVSIRDTNSNHLKFVDGIKDANNEMSDYIPLWALNGKSFETIYNSLDINQKGIDTIFLNYFSSLDYTWYDSSEKYDGAFFDIDSLNSLSVGAVNFDNESSEEDDRFKFQSVFDLPIDYILTTPLPNFEQLVTSPILIMNADSPRLNFIQETMHSTDLIYLNRITAKIESSDSFSTVKLFDVDKYYSSNQDVDKAMPKLIQKTITNILVSIMAFIVLVCLLNVVNISLTNLNTRKRELAALRSVGMSQKQIQKMLFYESVRLVWSPLIFGTLIGVLASFSIIVIVNLFVVNGQPLAYGIDIKAILISWSILLLLIVSNTIITIVKSKNHSIIDSLRNL
ncbi:FtsX-like permease family protein [Erysipelothrix inopinata]|uniref:FtsX-like permease family protein n=1 Tax=Erysipelothrix inopinata TaxID=225084 RepID=A0A7G9S030_9FIRM|nr:ABC transporter permease [Erysipelothrix inopinata]QNN61205.1 FtsX-like permease family protein [Erysipelothrix inopinata]